MKLIKRLSLLSVIAMSAMGLVACSEDDDSPSEPTNPDQGMVMAVHASPDAPAVDILVDNAVAKEALSFLHCQSKVLTPLSHRCIMIVPIDSCTGSCGFKDWATVTSYRMRVYDNSLLKERLNEKT